MPVYHVHCVWQCVVIPLTVFRRSCVEAGSYSITHPAGQGCSEPHEMALDPSESRSVGELVKFRWTYSPGVSSCTVNGWK